MLKIYQNVERQPIYLNNDIFGMFK